MRELIELNINDALRGSSPSPFIISGWLDAQRFWRQSEIVVPDIVLCDINFDKDLESPLNSVSPLKPTGLLYAIPFLATAKVRAAPVIINFHTGDPSLFAKRHLNTQIVAGEKPPAQMRALAAELLGLITAMIGVPASGDSLTGEEALEWLSQDSVSKSVKSAAIIARRRYRQELVRLSTNSDKGQSKRVLVDPQSYPALLAWCSRVRKDNSQGEDIWKDDPGVRLIYGNGLCDHISIRSLFRTHETRIFQSVAFDCEIGDEEAKKLAAEGWTKDGIPMVGAFVHSLGHWPRLFEKACELMNRFPPDRPLTVDDTFAKQLSTADPDASVIKILAILFQIIRFHKDAIEQWEVQYTKPNWNPAKTLHSRGKRSLKECVMRVHGELLQIESPNEEDFGEAMSKCYQGFIDEDSLNFDLQLLKSMGAVVADTSDGTRLEVRPMASEDWDRLPPIPDKFKSEHLKHPIKSLGVSFGYTENGSSRIISRWVAEFSGEKAATGEQFISDLKNGRLPSWLNRLAEQYVIDRLKWEELLSDRLSLVAPVWLRSFVSGSSSGPPSSLTRAPASDSV